MIEYKGMDYRINISSFFNRVFYMIYFISLILYTKTLIEEYIFLSIVSCLLIAWLNPQKVNYLISSYIGFFVISIVSGVNYLIYFSILSFVYIFLIHHRNFFYPFKTKLFYSFFFVIISVGVSVVNSVNVELAKEAFLAFGIALLILYSIQVLSRTRYLLRDLYWNITLYISSMVAVFFVGHTLQDLNSTPRALIYLVEDSGVRSNTIAGYSAIFLFICIGCFISNREISRKIISSLTIILILVILFFTISRGAILGIIIAFLPLIFFKINKKIVLIVWSAIFTILLFIIFNPNFLLESRLIGANTNDYSNGRFYYYELAYDQMFLNPLIGNGMYQFGFLAGMNRLEDPHNWLLAYLSGIGIIGTFFFVFFIVTILKKIIYIYTNKLRTREIIPFAQAILVPVIHGLFEPTLSTSMPILLFCILVPILFSKVNKQEIKI